MRRVLFFLLFSTSALGQFVGTTGAGVAEPDTFKFDIETENEDDSFTLPIYDGGVYNFVVDWGDESSSTITAWNDGDNPHTYEDAGISTYTIKIVGTIKGFRFNNGGDADLVTDIQKWGCLQLGNLGDYFCGCGNLTVSATDMLILSGITDMSLAFQLCTSLTTIPSIEKWDMSKVVTIYGMFHSCAQFNDDLSGWETGSMTNIGYCFYGCDAFNSDIGSWDVSNVTIMTWLFYGADIFNQDIGGWTTSSLTNSQAVFDGALAFDQDISGWDMSGVSNISNMFNGATSFDQSLAAWDITNITDMSGLFNGVTLSTANYNAILIGWEAQTEQSGVTFSAGNSKYSAGVAATARGVLVNTSTWDISDGGQEEEKP